MIDLVSLKLKAGDGGDGRVSFYRTKGITKGGPNGGNGGRGGDIILRANNQDSTLRHLAGVKEILATKGQNGSKFNKTGKDGENIVISVPVGTIVWLVAENNASQYRRQQVGLQRLLKKDEITAEKFILEKEGQALPPRVFDNLPEKNFDLKNFSQYEQLSPTAIFSSLDEGQIIPLITLDQPGQEVVICQGGFGGRGNNSFKSSTHRTPLEAEFGTAGEAKIIFLESRSLADIGLVGFPNAGKSSLLSRLTSAQPKIGNYPFTTLQPVLGVIDFNSREGGAIIADIPGIISGASQGKGLGLDFLRHIENCKILLHVFALEENIIFDSSLSNREKANLVWEQVKELRYELSSYQEDLLIKPIILVLNKTDLYSPKLLDEIISLHAKFFPQEKLFCVSAATKSGLHELKSAIQQALKILTT